MALKELNIGFYTLFVDIAGKIERFKIVKK